jgi:hypothetical protein
MSVIMRCSPACFKPDHGLRFETATPSRVPRFRAAAIIQDRRRFARIGLIRRTKPMRMIVF